MTEAEWLSSIEPQSMLDFIEGTVTDRKLRLLGYAFVRLAPITSDGKPMWDLLPECNWFTSPEFLEIDCHTVIETVERAVDERIREDEWARCYRHAYYVEWAAEPDAWLEDRVTDGARLRYVMACAVQFTVKYATQKDQVFLGRYLVDYLRYLTPTHRPRVIGRFKRHVCHLLRDICGNPVRSTMIDPASQDCPVSLDPNWLAPKLISLAQRIYHERAFSLMTTLADALEAAGCNDSEILNHCRKPGAHNRGCWVVDLILGKS